MRWAQVADEVEFAPGQVLLSEDRSGYWFFLIVDGSVVRKKRGRVIDRLGPGEHVGEEAAIIHRPQPATVVAETTVRAFAVGRQYLLPLLDDQPMVRRRLFPAISDRDFETGLRELRQQAALEWKAISKARLAQLAKEGRPLVRFRSARSGSGAAQPIGLLTAAILMRSLAGPSKNTAAPSRPLGWRTRLAIGLIATASVVAAAFLYHPPIVVVTPSRPIDAVADITITGVPVHAVRGKYVFTPVRFERPNTIGAVAAVLQHRHRLRPSSGVPREEVLFAAEEARRAFRRSQKDAVASAAIAAGMDVKLKGGGAVVVDVLERKPSSSLRAGDVIHSVDGKPVKVASDVPAAAAANSRTTRVRLAVERHGDRIDLEATTKELAERVVLATVDPSYDLPFSVRFKPRQIAGPSGGLIYALALADLLGQDDIAAGRTIAATGTMDPTGAVGPVGFLDHKTKGALLARADLFFVPAGQTRFAPDRGVRVRGVLTLRGAVSYLRDSSAKGR